MSSVYARVLNIFPVKRWQPRSSITGISVPTWSDEKIFEVTQRIQLDPKDVARYRLMVLPTEQVERLFRQEAYTYVGPGGSHAGINGRYEQFERYVETGKPIYASSLRIQESPLGEIRLKFIDGRHRFALLRDRGVKYIPFAVHKDDLPFLQSLGRP